MGQNREYRATHGALETPDGNATQPGPGHNGSEHIRPRARDSVALCLS